LLTAGRDYLSFGAVDELLNGPVLVTNDLNVDLKLQQFRAGLNFRF
jgi:hypothetical protein